MRPLRGRLAPGAGAVLHGCTAWPSCCCASRRWTARPPRARALVGGQDAARAGPAPGRQGHFKARRQDDRGQPRVVAGHHGRARRVPRGALRVQGRGAHWPLVGRLVDAGDTLYIERERKRDALRVVHQSAEALQAGDTVAVFPEGTTGPATRCCPSTPTCCRRPSPPPCRCSRWRCATPTAASRQPAALWMGDTTLAQTLWQLATADGLVAHLHVLPARPRRMPTAARWPKRSESTSTRRWPRSTAATPRMNAARPPCASAASASTPGARTWPSCTAAARWCAPQASRPWPR
jgi:hypothetical protein